MSSPLDARRHLGGRIGFVVELGGLRGSPCSEIRGSSVARGGRTGAANRTKTLRVAAFEQIKKLGHLRATTNATARVAATRPPMTVRILFVVGRAWSDSMSIAIAVCMTENRCGNFRDSRCRFDRARLRTLEGPNHQDGIVIAVVTTQKKTSPHEGHNERHGESYGNKATDDCATQCPSQQQLA